MASYLFDNCRRLPPCRQLGDDKLPHVCGGGDNLADDGLAAIDHRDDIFYVMAGPEIASPAVAICFELGCDENGRAYDVCLMALP